MILSLLQIKFGHHFPIFFFKLVFTHSPQKYHYTSQKQILGLLAFSSTEETLLCTKALTSQQLIKLQRIDDANYYQPIIAIFQD